MDLESLGMKLSGGYAVEPEQSTVAIVAHHPQAEYFSMKSGRVRDVAPPDDLIKGSHRDPTQAAEIPDADPEAGDMPEMATSSSGRAGAE
jgi:5-methyltetrahydrofolate--homocysteine methyltransferase